ncbi:unnamed protein product [Amaranthus hypochondriacus]
MVVVTRNSTQVVEEPIIPHPPVVVKGHAYKSKGRPPHKQRVQDVIRDVIEDVTRDVNAEDLATTSTAVPNENKFDIYVV